MKTCIVSHGSPIQADPAAWWSCQGLRLFSVLYHSQLVRLCFQAFLLKTEKQLPLPLTLGPHTTVTKSRSMLPLPPLEERRKALMRNSHLHPLSWLSRWSHQDWPKRLADALVKPEWSEYPTFAALMVGGTFTEDKNWKSNR